MKKSSSGLVYICRNFIWFMLVFVLLLTCAGCTSDAGNSENTDDRTVQLMISSGEFTVTNAEGQTLTGGDKLAGDMSVISQESMESENQSLGVLSLLEVSYSRQFICEWASEGDKEFGVIAAADPGNRECTASGTGLEKITIDPEGQIELTGSEMAFELFLSMPCEQLGEAGCVRFYGAASEIASVKVNVDESRIEFSGITPGSAYLTYAGTAKGNMVPLDLEVGSGTIDLSTLSEDGITITEDGLEARTITE